MEFVEVNMDTVMVSLWNAHIVAEGYGNKISFNDKGFFDSAFENAYDAAWAVSLSGKWCWSDEFVFFGEDGYLTSFSHWDDENSPIDLDKINIGSLIQSLKKWHKNKKGCVDNIPRAIHDALQE